MEEWKTYKLADICDLIPGFAFKSADFGDYEDRAIKIGDIQPPYVNYKTTSGVDVHHYTPSKLAKYIVRKGDFVLAMTGATIGKIGRYIHDTPAYLNQRVLLFKPHSSVNSKFVYYSLLSPLFQKYVLNHIDSETAQPNISGKSVSGFEINLPSRKMQDRIADLMSTIDDKIDLNTRINHNIEEQARSQFEAWCAKCVESKLIRELSSNILDYTPNNHKKVILLNSSDVTEGHFESLPFVDNQNLKGQFKKRFMKGDILYSEIRPRNHHFAICYFDADEYIASTRLMVIRKNDKEISSDALLYQYLLMPSVLEEFTSKTESRSGTFPQGNYDDLSSSEVPYSSDNLQIGKALDAIYGVIWANMEENKRLASLRDSLIPQLMSGLINC